MTQIPPTTYCNMPGYSFILTKERLWLSVSLKFHKRRLLLKIVWKGRDISISQEVFQNVRFKREFYKC